MERYPDFVEPFLGEEPIGWPLWVDAALAEDVGNGDVSRFAIPESKRSYYEVEAQAEGVICGIGLALDLLAPLGDAEEDEFAEFKVKDGDAVTPGTTVITGRLNSRELLRNERTALNFLMLLSGVSTLTAKFVKAIEGTRAAVLDTRKTMPGMRALQKYAVHCGGGQNHRMGLFDGILVKDNHIRAAGGVREAIDAVRAGAPHTMRIEVECSTVAQVDRALSSGADIILLDNMALGEMKDAVGLCKDRALVEASGGITLENARAVAKTGVDFISIGALTHSAPALPFHLEFR